MSGRDDGVTMSELRFCFGFKRWLLVDSNTTCTQLSGRALLTAFLLLLLTPLFSPDRDLRTGFILDSCVLQLLCNVFKSLGIVLITVSIVMLFPTHRQFFWLHRQTGIILSQSGIVFLDFRRPILVDISDGL